MTIQKYPLLLQYRQTVDMPKGARILDVQFEVRDEKNAFVMWALVDPEADAAPCKIVILRTGNHTTKEHAAALAHRGTLQDPEDGTVFHVFEELVVVHMNIMEAA